MGQPSLLSPASPATKGAACLPLIGWAGKVMEQASCQPAVPQPAGSTVPLLTAVFFP